MSAASLIACGVIFMGQAEGPVWWKDNGGYLLFSDINGNRRIKYAPGQGASVFRENTNRANGLTRDMPAQPQPQLGRKIGPPTAGQAALGKFISTINLSEGAERPYPLKTDPRPKGKATRVIITEYDLPRALAMPHVIP